MRYNPGASCKSVYCCSSCLGCLRPHLCPTNSVVRSIHLSEFRSEELDTSSATSHPMTLGVCRETGGRQDATGSYDHLPDNRNSPAWWQRKSWALGVTAEDWKGHSSWRNKLLDVARATVATRTPFGECQEGREWGLGNLVKVAEWGGDSEPVTTEVTPQVHMGLGSIKTETETNYRPVELCPGRLEGAVLSCVPQWG